MEVVVEVPPADPLGDQRLVRDVPQDVQGKAVEDRPFPPLQGFHRRGDSWLIAVCEQDRSIAQRRRERLLAIVLPPAIQRAPPAVGMIPPSPPTRNALVEGLIKQVGQQRKAVQAQLREDRRNQLGHQPGRTPPTATRLRLKQ